MVHHHRSGIYASKAIGPKGAKCKSLVENGGGEKKIPTESENRYHYDIMTFVYCFAR